MAKDVFEQFKKMSVTQLTTALKDAKMNAVAMSTRHAAERQEASGEFALLVAAYRYKGGKDKDITYPGQHFGY